MMFRRFSPAVFCCAVLLLLLPLRLTAAERQGLPAPLQGDLAVVAVPGGAFIAGSDRAEREMAYRLDEAAYGHSITRRQRWYEGEGPRRRVELAGFSIMRLPVTNRLYQAFLRDTGHAPPFVSPALWRSYGLIHPYSRVRRYLWRGTEPPPGQADHPVVLVSWQDANDFAVWLSARTGRKWRLPSAMEWEKAARGRDGRYFPWGNEFDPTRLNSADRGPFATTPAGRFPQGASPWGALDMAGQVYEWTADKVKGGRAVVKGGSWDDKGCGICRPAARHTRPQALKHILIGFRLLREDE